MTILWCVARTHLTHQTRFRERRIFLFSDRTSRKCPLWSTYGGVPLHRKMRMHSTAHEGSCRINTTGRPATSAQAAADPRPNEYHIFPFWRKPTPIAAFRGHSLVHSNLNPIESTLIAPPVVASDRIYGTMHMVEAAPYFVSRYTYGTMGWTHWCGTCLM